MDNLADVTVASLELDDNGSLPYGRSHWDSKPAEVHAMILKAAGPLTLFINGLLGDKDSLDEATVEALWTDAISIDWQGDLALLPDIDLHAGKAISRKRPVLDMLSLPVSRSMYGRLCTRFPDPTLCDDINPDDNEYEADIDPEMENFDASRLYHIPMRNGWFDLLDFSHPIALGWIAISFGHAGLLKHLAEHHGVDLGRFVSYWGRLAMDLAATSGSLDVVQMLHDAGNTSCSDDAMNSAAEHGHLHVVKWLHANRTEGCTTRAMDNAAFRGHLQVVIWLHENRTEGCSALAMDAAAEKGHLDVVRWLHANRTEGCTADAIKDAAANGHFQVVQFLLSCGYPFTFYALRHAKSEAIVDVLVDSMTLACAMEMLQTIRAQRGGHMLVERLERAVAEKQA